MNLKLLFSINATIFFFSFLIHFVWEMWQVPFFEGMSDAKHFHVIWMCTQASIGDGVIAVAAYTCGILIARNIKWLINPRKSEFLIYLGVGLLVTVVFEFVSTQVLGRWAYSDSMPLILGIGVIPLMQWLFIPIVVLYFSRIFVRGMHCID